MATPFTPYQFAEAECANFVAKRCAMTQKDCKLSGIERCKYFEDCLIPLQSHTQHPDHKNYATAIQSYLTSHKVDGSPKDIRHCACGTELLPRQRVCPECSRKHRKATYRESKRKQRLPCPQLS